MFTGHFVTDVSSIVYCYARCVAQRVEKLDNMAYVSLGIGEVFITDCEV